MSTPESVLYDAENDLYLVSNIVGSPSGKDDDAFISKVDPDGKVIEARWIDSKKPDVTLNAPKGSAIAGGILYVADIDELRKFDVKTGAPKGSIKIKGATFLNDVAVGPDGSLYVSDTGVKATAKGFEPTGTDAVYQITGDKPKALVKGKDLNGPNGLLVNDAGIWVVTMRSNELYRIEGGKKVPVTTLPKGTLDGIVQTANGKLLISSWDASAVFEGTASGPFRAVIQDVKGTADIGYDSKRQRVLLPLFLDNKIRIQAYVSPRAWKDMTEKERLGYMKKVVLPKMKAEFQAFDAKDFATMNCVTCHGPGVKQGKFDMPNPALPKLSVADNFKKHREKTPQILDFMLHKVEPQMAELLGEPPYDPKTGKGFGCFNCHTEQK